MTRLRHCFCSCLSNFRAIFELIDNANILFTMTHHFQAKNDTENYRAEI